MHSAFKHETSKQKDVVFLQEGVMTAAPYKVVEPEHWVFAGTGLEDGSIFGVASSTFLYQKLNDHSQDRLGTDMYIGKTQSKGMFSSRCGFLQRADPRGRERPRDGQDIALLPRCATLLLFISGAFRSAVFNSWNFLLVSASWDEAAGEGDKPAQEVVALGGGRVDLRVRNIVPPLFLTFACVCVSRACLGKRSFFMNCLDYETQTKGSVSAGNCNSGLVAVRR
jgi:hypothetical protein